jgi:hypothetical protein
MVELMASIVAVRSGTGAAAASAADHARPKTASRKCFTSPPSLSRTIPLLAARVAGNSPHTMYDLEALLVRSRERPLNAIRLLMLVAAGGHF